MMFFCFSCVWRDVENIAEAAATNESAGISSKIKRHKWNGHEKKYIHIFPYGSRRHRWCSLVVVAAVVAGFVCYSVACQPYMVIRSSELKLYVCMYLCRHTLMQTTFTSVYNVDNVWVNKKITTFADWVNGLLLRLDKESNCIVGLHLFTFLWYFLCGLKLNIHTLHIYLHTYICTLYVHGFRIRLYKLVYLFIVTICDTKHFVTSPFSWNVYYIHTSTYLQTHLCCTLTLYLYIKLIRRKKICWKKSFRSYTKLNKVTKELIRFYLKFLLQK